MIQHSIPDWQSTYTAEAAGSVVQAHSSHLASLGCRGTPAYTKFCTVPFSLSHTPHTINRTVLRQSKQSMANRSHRPQTIETIDRSVLGQVEPHSVSSVSGTASAPFWGSLAPVSGQLHRRKHLPSGCVTCPCLCLWLCLQPCLWLWLWLFVFTHMPVQPSDVPNPGRTQHTTAHARPGRRYMPPAVS